MSLHQTLRLVTVGLCSVLLALAQLRPGLFLQPAYWPILFLPLITSVVVRSSAVVPLFTLGCCLFVLAPAGRLDPSAAGVTLRQTVLVVDLSRSMAAADVRLTASDDIPRAEAARQMITNWLTSPAATSSLQTGDQFALVGFAAQAAPLAYMSADRQAIIQSLGPFTPETPPLGTYPADDTNWTSGTRIGSALSLACELFPTESAESAQRQIILFSDGDDPSSDRQEEIEAGLRFARAGKIPVHVVGLGDARDGGLIFSEDRPVRTRQEAEVLAEIARQTGGKYLSVSSTETATGGRTAGELGQLQSARSSPTPSLAGVFSAYRPAYIWGVVPLLLALALWYRQAEFQA